MPIGVPRIIYCWGEELPAQWTDIYNFIFRRRMVFLMQYLDDELCNQICGLLINIHMEDRSKELEKKEIEKSGLFKTRTKPQQTSNGTNSLENKNVVDGIGGTTNIQNKKNTGPSFEDLLAADEDLGIDENNTLEQYTLQKITMEWLNWNAQFFDYADEPYLFYLAETLSKDFPKSEAQMLYSSQTNLLKQPHSILAASEQNGVGGLLRNQDQKIHQTDRVHKNLAYNLASFMGFFEDFYSKTQTKRVLPTNEGLELNRISKTQSPKNEVLGLASHKPSPLWDVNEVRGNKGWLRNHLDIYSPFRLLANFAAQDYNFKDINPLAPLNSCELDKKKIVGMRSKDSSFSFEATNNLRNSNEIHINSGTSVASPKELQSNPPFLSEKPPLLPKPKKKDLLSSKKELFQLFNNTLRKKDHNNNNMSKLLTELGQKNFTEKTSTKTNLLKTAKKTLSQRHLRKEYIQDKTSIGKLSSIQTTDSFLGNRQKLSTQQFNATSFEKRQMIESSKKIDSFNYLDFYSYNDSYNEFRNTQRGKQTERALQEEEAKKVFVIINSFGGSVGNGITVHDALQFIKAGSLTLALGVAASAASLALAGGTIGERYVTEGCHVMIHQPESSIQGQASDIWIDSQEIMKIRLDVAEIYSLATYRPRHKILRDLDRDFYLTATETIHYGLADEIATNEVMHEIIEMTSKVWDYHDIKQQRLLESRDSSNSGVDTQSQN